MATKKSATKTKSGVLKVAEKIGSIAGTVVGRKNQLLRKAGEVIDNAKAKLQSITGAKKTAAKKVKKAVKKAAKNVKDSAQKVAKKASAAKKKVNTATRKAKKEAKKAVSK